MQKSSRLLGPQWSGGVTRVTKPIRSFSQIDTALDFLIAFGCMLIEYIALEHIFSMIYVSFDVLKG